MLNMYEYILCTPRKGPPKLYSLVCVELENLLAQKMREKNDLKNRKKAEKERVIEIFGLPKIGTCCTHREAVPRNFSV